METSLVTQDLASFTWQSRGLGELRLIIRTTQAEAVEKTSVA